MASFSCSTVWPNISQNFLKQKATHTFPKHTDTVTWSIISLAAWPIWIHTGAAFVLMCKLHSGRNLLVTEVLSFTSPHRQTLPLLMNLFAFYEMFSCREVHPVVQRYTLQSPCPLSLPLSTGPSYIVLHHNTFILNACWNFIWCGCEHVKGFIITVGSLLFNTRVFIRHALNRHKRWTWLRRLAFTRMVAGFWFKNASPTVYLAAFLCYCL